MLLKAHSYRMKTDRRDRNPVGRKIERMPIPKQDVDVGARTKMDCCYSTYGMSRVAEQGQTNTASTTCYKSICWKDPKFLHF